MNRRGLLLGLGALAVPSGALACAVPGPPFDPTKSRLPIIAVARADKVTKLRGWEQSRVRFTITQRVRGAVPEPVVEAMLEPDSPCDYDFETPKPGGLYVLYMQRTRGKLSVGAHLSLAKARQRDPLFRPR